MPGDGSASRRPASRFSIVRSGSFIALFLLLSAAGGLRVVPAASLLLSKATLAPLTRFAAGQPRSLTCPVRRWRKVVIRGAPPWAIVLFHAGQSESAAPPPSLCPPAWLRWPGTLRTRRPVGRAACAAFDPGPGSMRCESARRACHVLSPGRDDARGRG